MKKSEGSVCVCGQRVQRCRSGGRKVGGRQRGLLITRRGHGHGLWSSQQSTTTWPHLFSRSASTARASILPFPSSVTDSTAAAPPACVYVFSTAILLGNHCHPLFDLNIICLALHISYIFVESIGFTRAILTFPLCVFLSFSTSMLTVTLSNTAISTSSLLGPDDPIVRV